MKKNEKNRKFILKALLDPEFRKRLETEPVRALDLEEFNEVNKQEVRLILAAVKGINAQIAAAADELLCLNGPGPCGVC